MKLIYVNVSMPITVDHLGRGASTGIYNDSVTGRVMVCKLNVDGDFSSDGGLSMISSTSTDEPIESPHLLKV